MYKCNLFSPLFLQVLRTEKMDRFFESVSSLMSNLLRSCVTNSIYDLVDLVEEYIQGNRYDGAYNIMRGLGLPFKTHVVHFFMVSIIYHVVISEPTHCNVQLDLQLPVQSVPITTKVESSNPTHGKVYSIQHYVIKFISDL